MAWYKHITIEIPLLFIFSSFLLIGSVLTNLVIYRTCYIILEYDENECALLGKDVTNETIILEKLVQPTANIVTMTYDMMMAIFPVIICIFAGPWSDKYGRKPVQLMALTGLTLSMTILAVLIHFKNVSPWYFMIATFPTMLTGSIPTYLTVVLAYLNDISTNETRALRMAIFESLTVAGLLIGTISSAPILYATNYETIFGLAACLLGLSTLYTVFFVPETVKVKKGEESKITESFRCSYIAEMVKVILKKRNGYNRIIILLIFITICLTNFITSGQGVVRFQFLREKLAWTLTKNNYFNCFSQIVNIVGTISGTIILNKILKFKETIVVILSLISSTGSCLLYGLATNDYYIFVGSVVAILSGAGTPLLRTRMAQIIPSDEMGKIFSLIIGVGGLFSLGATFLYTIIYNATIKLHSGSFYFLSAFLYMFSIFLVGVIVIFEMCTPKGKLKFMFSEIQSYKTKEVF